MHLPSVVAVKPPAKIYGAEPPQVGTFTINWADGRAWTVKRFNTRRPGGCRYKVFNDAGALLFDTNDCFDLSNANNKLDDWLSAQKALLNTPW